MSIQHIWNLFQLLGLFTCRKLATLSWNFVTETCKQLLGVDYVAKNWALAMMLKALPLVFFCGAYCCWKSEWWPLLEEREKRFTDQGKTDRFLAKFASKNNHKIGRFYRLLFGEVCPKLPWNSREIGRFFPEFVPKNAAKFDFFFRDLSEALP